MGIGWKKTRILLLGCVSLMALSSLLEAEHAPVRDTLGQPVMQLLHSSSTRSTNAAAAVCTVDPSKELFITDVSVVDDCYRTTWAGSCPGTLSPAIRGAWTFGRLMEGIFGTNDTKMVAHRTRQWLKLWMEDQVVNGEPVLARTAMRELVLEPWERASGPGGLDLKKAPFRLLAIVVRTDISGHPGRAGELRLIYNLLDEHSEPTPFTLIFEYAIPSSGCHETREIREGFHALSSLEFGPEYNAALQAMTDRIIGRGAAPDSLNGSTLLAVRTNESFLGTPWEMRSFGLALPEDEVEDFNDQENGKQKPKGRLVHQPHPNTPMGRFQGTQTLADFITEYAPLLIADQDAPLMYRGEPFLAGVAHNDLSLGWAGPEPVCLSAPRLPRRILSLRSCQGCHGKDTETSSVHVSPRKAGEPSELSAFLKGPFKVFFDQCKVGFGGFDLQRRKNFQCRLLTETCPE